MIRVFCAAFLLAAVCASPALADITSTGSISPADPTGWGPSTTARIGDTGPGSVTVNGGSLLRSSVGNIGNAVGPVSTVTIDGPGSKWSSDVNLGVAGSGALVITNGGNVSGFTSNYLGTSSAGIGTAVINGSGSTWNSGGWTFVGQYGTGTISITNGGALSNTVGMIGDYANSKGTVVVDGSGSKWSNMSVLFVGDYGNGTLTIANGGAVTSDSGAMAFNPGTTGVATVDGAGSKWTDTGGISVGNGGTAALNISGGGAITAPSVSVNGSSLLAVDAGRGSSLAIGGGTGALTNSGAVRFLAGAGAAAGGPSSPISAGTWSGGGAFQAVGGTWNAGSHVFTASDVAAGAAGTAVSIDPSQRQRMLVADSGSGKSLGASFLSATFPATVGLTASLAGGGTLSSLASQLSPGESVLSGWTLSATGYSAGDPVYLSLSVAGKHSRSDLDIWRYDGSAWTDLAPSDLTFDGKFASFTAYALGGYGYAVTGAANLLSGDANGDGKVDINDLNVVLVNYDRSTGMSWTTGDFNGDGRVDINDLSVVLINYDRTAGASDCGLAAVPEPGMPALLAAGLLGLLGYVWRTRR